MFSVRRVLLTIGVAAGLSPAALRIILASHGGVSSVLIGNVAVVALAAAGVVANRERVARTVARFAPWLACGALLGAGVIGPLRIGPCVLTATLSFGLVGVVGDVGGIRGALTRAGVVLAAATVNFACLWPLTLGQHRPVAPAKYVALDLRAHTLLADIPLHDVWVAHLPGGGAGRTLDRRAGRSHHRLHAGCPRAGVGKGGVR
jgi:hypothetical protein